MKRLLIKLLSEVDYGLIWVETATRALRTKLVWLRWDLEDEVDKGDYR